MLNHHKYEGGPLCDKPSLANIRVVYVWCIQPNNRRFPDRNEPETLIVSMLNIIRGTIFFVTSMLRPAIFEIGGSRPTQPGEVPA